jgi:pimeloyl-ACP methyl ester carboxylesterase
MRQQRRSFISGTIAGVAAATAAAACSSGAGANDAAKKPLMVLVHGSWHSSFCWARVTPHLVRLGITPLAIDLPGCGLQGKFPSSMYARPFDESAFKRQASPVASITLDDYASYLSKIVDDLVDSNQGPIYLVGHSLGGLTLNKVAESKARKIAGLIYLSAIMPSNNESLVDTLGYASAQQSYVPQGKAGSSGNPTIGATRVDLNSPDPVYREVVRQAYCHDVTQEDYLAWANMLVPDDPEIVATQKILLSQAGFGSIPRTYIRCLDDRIIPPAWANDMIKKIDEFVGGKTTTVKDIATSHSPFLSKPEDLASILASSL